MVDLQKDILKKTIEIVGPINLVNIFIATIITSGITYLLLLSAEIINGDFWQIIIIFTLVGIWIYIREARHRKRNLEKIQAKIIDIENIEQGIDLYIPVFTTVLAKPTLKNSLLFIKKNKIFLAAFRGRTVKTKSDDIKIVEQGKNFYFDIFKIHKNNKVVTFMGRLNDSDYRFDIANQTEVVELIKNIIK